MRVSVLTILMAFLLAAGIPFGVMAGPAPDSDNDTVPDAVDNCLNVPNGAPGQPAGALVSQCDTDGDGYGNACDNDQNQDGIIGGPDYGPITSNWTGSGHPVNAADNNCDGIIGGPDYGPVTSNWTGVPGPSGLWCAGLGVTCP